MRDELKVRDWIANFSNGDYESRDVSTQVDAGWYDWFCKDSSLRNKTLKMGNIVKQVKDGGKVDLDNWYVWFKNNCPMSGPLYDDFRFADLEEGNVQFTIQIESPWSDYRYTVYGRKNQFVDMLAGFNTVKELVDWLNTPWGDETC